MKSLFLSIFIFSTLSSYASIVETSMKVKTTYTNSNGKEIKLLPVRVFLSYNPDANIFSPATKNDCNATGGKSDLLSFWKKELNASCLSYKSVIIVPESFLISLLYRSNSFSIFINSSKLNGVRVDGVLSNLTDIEFANNANLLFAVRNLLGQATKTQIISLTKSNKFVLKGSHADFFTLEFFPKATKTLR